jgi:hypothetical protein
MLLHKNVVFNLSQETKGVPFGKTGESVGETGNRYFSVKTGSGLMTYLWNV